MDDREKTPRQAASYFRRLLPLAQRLVSDEFSADERRHFRRVAGTRSPAGNRTVCELSDAMNKLCSETARKQLIGGKVWEKEANRIRGLWKQSHPE